MTTQTTTLADFLLAQIAADEATTRACINHVGSDRAGDAYADGSGMAERDDFPSYPWGLGKAELDFMAGAGHPAHVLAQCAALRAVVELHSGSEDFRCQDGNWVYEPCETLNALAAPYADREGYREEWRP